MRLPSIDSVWAIKQDLQNRVSDLKIDIATKEKELNEHEKNLYDINLREIYLNEIERVARIQFVRFHDSVRDLTKDDIAEIEKWVGRCKSTESLKDIIDAINELGKYKSGQVGNVYGLVQKIVIEGAFHGRKKISK